MKRKRGAPFGNQNAYKHGFYSSHFSQPELQNLRQNATPDLVDEIGLVRIATARFLASLQADSAPRDLDTELAILRVINLGALSINGLVRTRLMLLGGRRGALDLLDPQEAPASDAQKPGQASMTGRRQD